MTSMGEDNPVDDAAVGYEQARRLRATMAAADIDRGRLWLYYFGLGGDVSEFEVDAYLHHSLLLPRLQRDVLAQAANEILADLAPPMAPYACEVRDEKTDPPAQEAAPASPNAPAQDSDVMDRDDPGALGD